MTFNETMMCPLNVEQNLNSNKYEKYPAVEAGMKGIIIHGGTTLALLPLMIFTASLIEGKGMYGSTKDTYKAMPMIFVTSLAYSAFGALGFFVRSDMREAEHAHTGGSIGGGVCYIARTLAMEAIMPSETPLSANQFANKLLIKGAIGGLNGYRYELCNDDEKCANDPDTALKYSINVERDEGFISSFTSNEKNPLNTLYGLIKGSSTPYDVAIGLGNTAYNIIFGYLAGYIGTKLAFNVYVPNIDNFHKAYDSFEDKISTPAHEFFQDNTCPYIKDYAGNFCKDASE